MGKSKVSVSWLETVMGRPMPADLRAKPDLASSALLRLERWQEADNIFDRLMAERSYPEDWYLCFGGLLSVDGPYVEEAAFFARIAPGAQASPVVLYQHGFGFDGIVARDLDGFAALEEPEEDDGFDILAPPDAALTDLSRAAWIIADRWPGTRHSLVCADWPKPLDHPTALSAQTSAPVALCALMSRRLEGDDAGFDRVVEALSGSGSRLVQDAIKSLRSQRQQ